MVLSLSAIVSSSSSSRLVVEFIEVVFPVELVFAVFLEALPGMYNNNSRIISVSRVQLR